MKIYKKEKRFYEKTGEPYFIKVFKEERCDFSGKIVNDKETDYPAYYCKFSLNYEDQDPCFGASGEEFNFGEKYNIDMDEFLSDDYVVLDDYSGNKGSEMREFLRSAQEYDTLDAAFRETRINTARKLIENKIINPEDLNNET